MSVLAPPTVALTVSFGLARCCCATTGLTNAAVIATSARAGMVRRIEYLLKGTEDINHRGHRERQNSEIELTGSGRALLFSVPSVPSVVIVLRALQYLQPECRCRQLDAQDRRLVLHVEDRVD